MQRQSIILIAFLVLAVSTPFKTTQSQVAEQDSLALLSLYDALDGDNWIFWRAWKGPGPVSGWSGVLWQNQLSRTIPSENDNPLHIEVDLRGSILQYYGYKDGELMAESKVPLLLIDNPEPAHSGMWHVEAIHEILTESRIRSNDFEVSIVN